jgi:hypothetical protein
LGCTFVVVKAGGMVKAVKPVRGRNAIYVFALPEKT